MIHKVSVYWGRTDIPERTLQTLGALSAQCGLDPRKRRDVVTTIDTGIAQRAEELLRSAGARPWISRGQELPARHEYTVSHWREWEQADLDAARYLWLRAGGVREERRVSVFVEHESSEVLCIELKSLPRGVVGFADNLQSIFCPDSLREALESERFLHLRFAPVKIMREVSGSGRFVPVKGRAPWWQLRSDLVLPPMSPAIQRFRGRDGVILPRETSEPVGLREPPFNDVQPRYVRSEWQDVPEFDVAGTYEASGYGVYARRLVVSERFYNVCKRENLGADWVPLKIDPA